MDDELILKGIAKGKEQYLKPLMDRYIPYVGKIVSMIGGKYISKEDSEELISDVFYALWQSRKELRIDADIKPYLAQIARNKTKNKLRERSVLSKNTVENLDELQDKLNLSDEFFAKETIATIQGLVNELPTPEKDILYGYYFHQLKLRDIAQLLQLPLSTVKSKLYRGREKLKQAVTERGLYE